MTRTSPINQAEIWIAQKEYGNAISCLMKAVEEEEEDIELIPIYSLLIARLYVLLKEYGKAAAFYDRSFKELNMSALKKHDLDLNILAKLLTDVEWIEKLQYELLDKFKTKLTRIFLLLLVTVISVFYFDLADFGNIVNSIIVLSLWVFAIASYTIGSWYIKYKWRKIKIIEIF